MKMTKTFERTIEVCDIEGCETQVYYPKYYEGKVYCKKHLSEIVMKKHYLHFWNYRIMCTNFNVFIIRRCSYSFCRYQEDINISQLTNFKCNSINIFLELIYTDKEILNKIIEKLGGK